MNIKKIIKILGVSSKEAIFGMPSYSEGYASSIEGHASSINSTDTDSIDAMRDGIDTAVDNLTEASEKYDSMEYALDEWRDLACDLWEKLPSEIQKDYLYIGIDKKEQVEKAYALEVLKNL